MFMRFILEKMQRLLFPKPDCASYDHLCKATIVPVESQGLAAACNMPGSLYLGRSLSIDFNAGTASTHGYGARCYKLTQMLCRAWKSRRDPEIENGFIKGGFPLIGEHFPMAG
jgi:hypothetical protein